MVTFLKVVWWFLMVLYVLKFFLSPLSFYDKTSTKEAVWSIFAETIITGLEIAFLVVIRGYLPF